jgi:hypothetical protein
MLRAIVACASQESGSTSALTNLVSGSLDQANTTLAAVMEQYASTVHHWCPLLSEAMLQNGRDGSFDDAVREDYLSQLLILCVFLLARRACRHPEHVTSNLLYTTLKQMLALARASGGISLNIFRAEMLLAVYEYAHGLGKQAHVTLTSCAAMLTLIELDMRRLDSVRVGVGILEPLRANVIMLDRMVPLSTLSVSLPLAVSTRHPLSKLVAENLGTYLPDPSPSAIAPRKVHVRATVALVSGRVLNYIHALRCHVEPDETYDEVDAAAALLLKTLLRKPQPYTWLYCDAISMAFW